MDLASIDHLLTTRAVRKRLVLALEWLDPPMAAGH